MLRVLNKRMHSSTMSCIPLLHSVAAAHRQPRPFQVPQKPSVIRRCAQLACTGSSAEQAALPSSKGGYRVPPKEILDIVDAPSQPSLSYSPDRQLILQIQRPPALPPIFEMARPELKLAGLRIDHELFSRSKMGYSLSLAIVPADQEVPAPAEVTRPITAFPEGSWLNYVSWSPDGKYISFTVRSPGGPTDPPRQPLRLWVAEVSSGECKPLLAPSCQGLNTVFDDYTWLDDDHIVMCVVPEGAGSAPSRSPVPPGPRVQDNSSGKTSQNRTYPDLLKDEHDVALFEYYGTSELMRVHVPSGTTTRIGAPRLYTDIDTSPDGRYILVSWMETPYSFSVPCGRFPRRTQLWDRDGTLVKEMAFLPLAEDIPIAFNSCRRGPRGLTWRDDKPSEMYWMEAQDGGDAALEVSPRDVVYTMIADSAAEPSTEPSKLAQTDLRCGGVSWCDDDLALVYESWWKTRRSVISMIKPSEPAAAMEVLFDRNYEDAYTDPGSPLSRRTASGTYILAKIDGKREFLMTGTGASPEGNRPFIDLLNLDTKESRRLWQSESPYYESPGSIMSDADFDAPIKLDGLQMTMTRETTKDPPQSFIKTFTNDATESTERRVTNCPHPYPQLRDMQREVIRYPRNDGVMLTATLYTPPGYDKSTDGPLPAILWAYPREFKNKESAGQNRRSPYQFTSIGDLSPTLWVARGYAVLDGPTIPIVAEGEDEPNDTFAEQLAAGAQAAVDEGVRMGVIDATRVSVGGHSYGAFMAANLLHFAPDLFACAIARSGAYNRTLTPFGFQSEERTIWQAPETYNKMSPFMAADRIKKPILLIHGEEDNNPGTFPLQSERLYQALKGHGATCRLVVLPHESHGYRARESTLHTLYEQDQWLERYAGFSRLDPDYQTSDSENAAGTSSD